MGLTEHTPGSRVSKKEMKSNLGEVSSNQEGAGWAFDTVGDRNIRTLKECRVSEFNPFKERLLAPVNDAQRS